MQWIAWNKIIAARVTYTQILSNSKCVQCTFHLVFIFLSIAFLLKYFTSDFSECQTSSISSASPFINPNDFIPFENFLLFHGLFFIYKRENFSNDYQLNCSHIFLLSNPFLHIPIEYVSFLVFKPLMVCQERLYAFSSVEFFNVIQYSFGRNRYQ